MTISTESTPLSYNGDGVTTDFPITWKYFAKSHVVTTMRDSAGAETTWILDTDYSLTAAGVDSGGTLTATTAPTSGESIVVELDPPNTQASSLPIGGAFPSPIVEDGLDQAAQRDAKLEAVLDRTIRVPKTDSQNGTVLELPIDSVRANKYLAFDAGGALIVEEANPAGVAASTLIPKVATLSAMPGVDTTSNNVVYCQGRTTPNDGYEGFFSLVTGDQSANVTADISYKGRWVAPSSDASGASGALNRIDSALIESRWYAVGDGATDDRDALAAADSLGDMCVTLGVYRISSNMTISNTMAFEPGAQLSIDTGVTVTFSSPSALTSTRQQIFTGLGSVAFTNSGTVMPEWWGAAGDDSTDSFAAVLAAVDSLPSTGGAIHYDDLVYRTSERWILNSSRSNRTFYSTSKRATIKLESATEKNVFYIPQIGDGDVEEAPGDNICIDGLVIDGALATDGEAGIETHGGENISIINVTSNNWLISGCILRSVVGGSTSASVKNYRATNNGNHGIAVATLEVDASRILLAGIWCWNNSLGIDLSTGSATFDNLNCWDNLNGGVKCAGNDNQHLLMDNANLSDNTSQGNLSITPVAGTLVIGETVTGGTSGATGVIVLIVTSKNKLGLTGITGTFSGSETITGGTSGATATTTATSTVGAQGFYTNGTFRLLELTNIRSRNNGGNGSTFAHVGRILLNNACFDANFVAGINQNAGDLQGTNISVINNIGKGHIKSGGTAQMTNFVSEMNGIEGVDIASSGYYLNNFHIKNNCQVSGTIGLRMRSGVGEGKQMIFSCGVIEDDQGTPTQTDAYNINGNGDKVSLSMIRYNQAAVDAGIGTVTTDVTTL